MNKFKEIYNKYKLTFLFTLVIGFLAHMFIICNKIANHDDIIYLFSKGETINMGRWGLHTLSVIFPDFSMPWFNGIVTLIVMAVCACLISEILNVSSNFLRCIIGGVLVTFPSVTSTMTFMFTVNSYSIAILLAILSVYFALKKDKGHMILISILCLTLSLGIYQAYISVTLTLFVFILIIKCMDKEEKIKGIIFQGLKFIIIVIISLLLYLAISYIVGMASDVAFRSYQGIDQMGRVTFRDVIAGIVMCYKSMILIVTDSLVGIALNKTSKLIYICVIIINIIYVCINFVKIVRKDIKRAFTFLLLLLMLPISMNILYVLNPRINMHTIIAFSNCFIFIMPVILMKNTKTENGIKFFNKVACIVISIAVYNYIAFANECYLSLYMFNSNMNSFYTNLAGRIQSTEGYDEYTKVAFIGDYDCEVLNNTHSYFGDIDKVMGLFLNNDLLYYWWGKYEYIRKYIGVNFNMVSDKEKERLLYSQEVDEMAVYPYDGSIKKIGDTIVVKFSDTYRVY